MNISKNQEGIFKGRISRIDFLHRVTLMLSCLVFIQLGVFFYERYYSKLLESLLELVGVKKQYTMFSFGTRLKRFLILDVCLGTKSAYSPTWKSVFLARGDNLLCLASFCIVMYLLVLMVQRVRDMGYEGWLAITLVLCPLFWIACFFHPGEKEVHNLSSAYLKEGLRRAEKITFKIKTTFEGRLGARVFRLYALAFFFRYYYSHSSPLLNFSESSFFSVSNLLNTELLVLFIWVGIMLSVLLSFLWVFVLSARGELVLDCKGLDYWYAGCALLTIPLFLYLWNTFMLLWAGIVLGILASCVWLFILWRRGELMINRKKGVGYVGLAFGSLLYICYSILKTEEKGIIGEIYWYIKNRSFLYMNIWFDLFILLTGIIVLVGRLHDIGYQGWLALIFLLLPPFFLFFLVCFFHTGEKKENQYGPVPVDE